MHDACMGVCAKMKNKTDGLMIYNLNDNLKK